MHDFNIQEIDFSSVCALFPQRAADAHKGDFGRLLCICGSMRMPGAAAMSVQAALRSGVGLLTTATAAQNVGILASQCWESMYLPLQTDNDGFITWTDNVSILEEALEKADAVLIGCGLGQTEEVRHLVRNVLRRAHVPLILDADGLNAIANCIDIVQERTAPTILTPHPGEMARLLGKGTDFVQKDRLRALYLLRKHLPGAVLVLKGHETLIAGDGNILRNHTGNPGMSRGGSGDVLAGMIASFAAQGFTPMDAAVAGVHLHGMAGDLAATKMSQAAMLPREIISCIADVFQKIENCNRRER